VIKARTRRKTSFPTMMTDLMFASWETFMRRTLLIAQNKCSPAEYRRMLNEKAEAAAPLRLFHVECVEAFEDFPTRLAPHRQAVHILSPHPDIDFFTAWQPPPSAICRQWRNTRQTSRRSSFISRSVLPREIFSRRHRLSGERLNFY
jgi:hypothetical protein